MKVLVIVESSTKEKTIKKCLEAAFSRENHSYTVKASGGHICDLVKQDFGLNLKTLQPIYTVLKDKAKTVSVLRDLVKQTDKEGGITLLASDNDREGEAIAWHLQNILKPKKYKRIIFNEITKDALYNAVSNPKEIDMKMVNSQQARRVLDRLVGFNLTKILWQNFSSKTVLSAGRVQSVVLMLINQKEKDITDFVSEKYWNMLNTFNNNITDAKLYQNDKIMILNSKKDVLHILNLLKSSNNYSITSHVMNDVNEYPDKPFTTSTLQQKATSYGFSVKETMKVAQELYELGHITYMRTDSFVLSKEFQNKLSVYIHETFGREYENKGKTKNTKQQKNAQEAHEAIRPTKLVRLTKLTARQNDLYNLIFNRTVASMMIPATYKELLLHIEHDKLLQYNMYFLGKTKYTVELGFKKVYCETEKCHNIQDVDNIFKTLKNNKNIKSLKVVGNCIWSTPPQRFSEALMIKKMEEQGIGRPSTYVSTLHKLYDRRFIFKMDKKGDIKEYNDFVLKDGAITEKIEKRELYIEKNKIVPTDVGTSINQFLIDTFRDIVNVEFTSNMEADLDKIAQGDKTYDNLIKNFYKFIIDQCKLKTKSKVTLENKKCGFKVNNKDIIVRNARFGPIIEIPTATKSIYIPLSPYMKIKQMSDIDEINKSDIEFLLRFPVKYKNYMINYKSYGFFVNDGTKSLTIYPKYFEDLYKQNYEFIDNLYAKIKR